MKKYFRNRPKLNQQLVAAVFLLAMGLPTLGCESLIEFPWGIGYEKPDDCCISDTGCVDDDTDTYFIEDTDTFYIIDTETESESGNESMCVGGRLWHKEGVGSVDETAHSDAVGAIGPEGDFHLAFADRTALTYAVKSGDSWTLTYIDETDSRGARGIDMVVDAEGSAHIVYDGMDNIMYATNASGEFALYPLVGTVSCPCSLAMADDGTLHLASVTDVVSYLSGKGGDWSIPVQISTDSFPRGVCLVLDDGDAAHVSYCGPGLYYATNAGGSWTEEYIFRGGIDSSIALDPEGILYIAHSESPYGDLILSQTTLGNGEWTNSVWTSDDERHTAGPDLAVSGDGDLHLTEFKYGGIMYAEKMADEDEWQEYLLSDDQVPWTWSRIAINYTGDEIHIAYGREGDIAHLWTDERCE